MSYFQQVLFFWGRQENAYEAYAHQGIAHMRSLLPSSYYKWIRVFLLWVTQYHVVSKNIYKYHDFKMILNII